MSIGELFGALTIACGVMSFVRQRQGRALAQAYYDPEVKLWLHADGLPPERVARARDVLASSRAWLVVGFISVLLAFYLEHGVG